MTLVREPRDAQGMSGGALGKRRRVYLTLAQYRTPGKDVPTPCHATCRPIVSHKDILTTPLLLDC